MFDGFNAKTTTTTIEEKQTQWAKQNESVFEIDAERNHVHGCRWFAFFFWHLLFSFGNGKRKQVNSTTAGTRDRCDANVSYSISIFFHQIIPFRFSPSMFRFNSNDKIHLISAHFKFNSLWCSRFIGISFTAEGEHWAVSIVHSNETKHATVGHSKQRRRTQLTVVHKS